MKKLKIVLFVLLVLGLVGGTIAWFQYNKPHRDAASEKAAHTIMATELFSAFENDESTAMTKYGGQLLEVSGIVGEVIKSDENTIVLLESEHPLFGVKCMFLEHPHQPIEAGQSAIIKGFCSGLNGDVEITRCALIELN
jgi:hypothetical protein